MADAVPGAATDVVDKLAIIPAGIPDTDKAIGASNVPDETTVKFRSALVPTFIVAAVEFALSVKAGGS